MAIPIGLSLISMGARALGIRRDPLVACNFMIEFDGLLTGGFTQVEGLECTLETMEYREGGNNGYAHKLIGGASYPNLVLSRGYAGGDSLWNWFERVRGGEVARKNGTLMLLNDGFTRPVRWWDIHDALPVRWVGPAFDAQREAQVAIERLELVHRGIEENILSKSTNSSLAPSSALESVVPAGSLGALGRAPTRPW